MRTFGSLLLTFVVLYFVFIRTSVTVNRADEPSTVTVGGVARSAKIADVDVTVTPARSEPSEPAQ